MTATTITNDHLQDAAIQLTNYAFHWGLDEDDQQDIIIKFFETFDPTKGTNPATWVTYLAKQHLFVKARPAKKRTGQINSLDAIQSSNDFHTALHTNQEMDFIIDEQEANQLEVLKQLLNTLTPKQKTVIQKIYFEEQNQTEVAKSLGITRQCVQGHLNSAIKRMKANNKNINPFNN